MQITANIVASLDQVSVAGRVALIEAFQILERSSVVPLSADEKAAVDAAKVLLLQVDVSVNQAS